jgi:hypothetical protein
MPFLAGFGAAIWLLGGISGHENDYYAPDPGGVLHFFVDKNAPDPGGVERTGLMDRDNEQSIFIVLSLASL